MTNADEIGLKEWSTSLQSAYKVSNELFSGLAKKAGKIYGADGTNTGTSSNTGGAATPVSSSATYTTIASAASLSNATNNSQ